MALIKVRRRNGDTYDAIIDDEDAGLAEAVGTWNLDARGYVVRARKGQKSYRLHRLVLGLTPSDPSVDHRNGNKLDNRKENLVLRTQAQNSQNLAAINDRGASKYRGVSWHAKTGKWRGSAKLNGRYYSLGLHETEELAHAAVVSWRRQYVPHDERGVSVPA